VNELIGFIEFLTNNSEVITRNTKPTYMDHLTEKEKQALKELVDELKKLYGDNLSHVILYGSKARGDATEDSDIDILVVLKEFENISEEREKIHNVKWPICWKYDLVISVIIRNEQEYLTRLSPLLLNIKKEGIEL